MYKWAVKHKEFIGAIGGVFSSIGIVAALGFSIYSLYPKPQSAVIDLFATQLTPNEKRLVIYNGGTGPCVELKVEYKKDKFQEVRHILNYQVSSVVDAKYDEKTDTISYPAQITYPLGVCSEKTCIINAGFFSPGNIFPLSFFGGEDSLVHIQCSGIRRNIRI